MTVIRFVLPALVSSMALVVTGCGTTSGAPQQIASRDCKVVPADFVGKPKKNPTRAEQAEAELKLSRFAASSGGYGIGNSLVSDINRECS